ncbi:MAG: 3-hydroxyacyl-CoA dehydrogenase [Pseudomonadota bacterium]
MTEQEATRGRVAVIGCGLVGRSWAIAFARGGYGVRLYDRMAGVAEDAVREIARMAPPLAELGLLGGETPDRVLGRIAAAETLAEATKDASHVQENVAERLDVKRTLLTELEQLVEGKTVLASSTSALMPSDLSQGLAHPERCLVAHPLNPPHLVPAVEIVPGPRTSAAAMAATARLMTTCGQSPIRMRAETEGFVMNRLQGALLDEAFALVAEDLASVDDIDTAIRDGLARRWSVVGPFETIDLNAPDGVAGFFERYGAAYETIGRHRPSRPAWVGVLGERVVAARRKRLDLADIADRQAWRDARLAQLAAHIVGRDAAEACSPPDAKDER